MKRNATAAAEIVRIGNSRGVRIPKTIREQMGLTGKVSMVISGGALVIRPERKPREGWDEAFARAARHDREERIWPDGMRNAFDDAERTW
jgi:antitoxin MazE